MDLPTDCMLELQHIKLELDNERSQHLRHFIDQYYCYKNGYLRSTGTPDWEQVVWGKNEAVSEGAAITKDRKAVVKEHVIPLKRIREELKKLAKAQKTELEDIRLCIDKHLLYATITKIEDQKLRDLKLTSKMPREFDDPNSDLYQDIFARYKKAGIKLVQTKGS